MGTFHRKKVPTSFSFLLPSLEQSQMLLKRPVFWEAVASFIEITFCWWPLGPFQQVKCRRLVRLPQCLQPRVFLWLPATEATRGRRLHCHRGQPRSVQWPFTWPKISMLSCRLHEVCAENENEHEVCADALPLQGDGERPCGTSLIWWWLWAHPRFAHDDQQPEKDGL